MALRTVCGSFSVSAVALFKTVHASSESRNDSSTYRTKSAIDPVEEKIEIQRLYTIQNSHQYCTYFDASFFVLFVQMYHIIDEPYSYSQVKLCPT